MLFAMYFFIRLLSYRVYCISGTFQENPIGNENLWYFMFTINGVVYTSDHAKHLHSDENATGNCCNINRKYKDYVYRKMLVQEYLKK